MATQTLETTQVFTDAEWITNVICPNNGIKRNEVLIREIAWVNFGKKLKRKKCQS